MWSVKNSRSRLTESLVCLRSDRQTVRPEMAAHSSRAGWSV